MLELPDLAISDRHARGALRNCESPAELRADAVIAATLGLLSS